MIAKGEKISATARTGGTRLLSVANASSLELTRAGGSAAGQAVAIVGDQPIGPSRQRRDTRQKKPLADQLPQPSGATQGGGDRLVPAADRAVQLDQLDGVGDLVLGQPERGQVDELPGDDVRVGPDPLQQLCTGGAEPAVAVIDEHPPLFVAAQLHDSSSSRSTASCKTSDRVLRGWRAAMK